MEFEICDEEIQPNRQARPVVRQRTPGSRISQQADEAMADHTKGLSEPLFRSEHQQA